MAFMCYTSLLHYSHNVDTPTIRTLSVLKGVCIIGVTRCSMYYMCCIVNFLSLQDTEMIHSIVWAKHETAAIMASLQTNDYGK